MNKRYRATQNFTRCVGDGLSNQPVNGGAGLIPASAPARKTWLRIAQFTALVAAALIVQVAMAQTSIPQPSRGLMPNPAAGKQLYGAKCASCHGLDLKGSKEGPPFLHSYYVPSHHSDAAFQIAARDGAKAHHWQFGDMKPVPDVSADDVAHITAYVRAEQRQNGFK